MANPVTNPASAEPGEAEVLLGLCRAGRLYEVEQWIASGKPISAPLKAHTSALIVAINKGFYSLAELLLKHGADPLANGNALAHAVRRRRIDIVQLLIRSGADARSVDFGEVARAGDSAMVRLFLDNGADPTYFDAFADALLTGNSAMLGIFREYRSRLPCLQEQADIALRHCCGENRIGNASRLLWAGADPRTMVRRLRKQKDDRENWESALKTAVLNGHLEIVHKIGIDSKRDDLTDLLLDATMSGNVELVRELVGQGADPNVGVGACTCLGMALWKLESHSSLISTSSVSSGIPGVLPVLLELGAVWEPSGEEIRSVRGSLYRLRPYDVVTFIRCFKDREGCRDEVLLSLLDTPRMLKHLCDHLRKLERWFPSWEVVRRAADRRTIEKRKERRW